MSSWNLYNKTVRFIVGENTYDIPIWNMRVSSSPYSRESGESTIVRAFDGRSYARKQGWRSRVSIDWPEMTPTSQGILYDFLLDLYTTRTCTIVLNPDFGTQLLEVVIEDAGSLLVAQFDNSARLRPASLNLVSVNIDRVAPTWITMPPVADFQYVYATVGASGDQSWIVRSIRDEDNLGAWSSDVLVTDSALNGKAFGRIKADENAGFIFVAVWDSIAGSTELRKYPITGGASYDSLFTISKEIIGFDIDRGNQICYLSTTSGVSGTALMYAVDYTGVDTLIHSYNPAINGGLYGLAYDRNSFLYYFRLNQSIDTQFRRITVDGLTDTSLGVVSVSLTFARAQANASSGYYFHMNNSQIYRTPIPSGGSNSSMTFPVQPGVAVDWNNGLVYYCFGTGGSKSIRRIPIEGGSEVVVALVATGTAFDDIDLGV